MKNFVGIDLGTTNSVICSYDGLETRIWKSPEQNDVTPSAIYIDRRGNKYVGKRAYDFAPHSPDNSAVLFKRLMGTSTPIELSAVNLTKTPEECSAEVLKVLFGYLPEEIRNDPETATVITVPAAFNQMQKDATMQAASMAGLGKVALMQEPVAAVMSVMRTRTTDGMFLIYDLGGGTLDVAIAQSMKGRVNLLAHGGIAMCGGRDFDRVLMDNIVRPWLLDNFSLPQDFVTNSAYKSLVRLAVWATERAKIELSAQENAVISLSEVEVRAKDTRGKEIYLAIPLQRDAYDRLIAARVRESVDAVRETLKKAGVPTYDLERIVFVGGPTNYKPLRDKVAFELGISACIDVNPMTAVAEGASLFAESIDWSTSNRSRKNMRGQIFTQEDLGLTFNYIARTPDTKAKIAIQLASQEPEGFEFQVDSLDTGWTSGRLSLKQGAMVDVLLAQKGNNAFKVSVFDSVGNPVVLKQDRIVITQTAATVDAIPASHSIAVEVLNKLGGSPMLDYLVRSGDFLPKRGKKVFKAVKSLKAGAAGSLNLKLWEGEIDDPVTDNRPIGVLKISGSDFDEGVIFAGADLECEYEILDSGNIVLEVSVPCIGSVFHSKKNFYSRKEGQLDYTVASAIVFEQGKQTLARIDAIEHVVDDPRLALARQKVQAATSLSMRNADIESAQETMEKVFESKQLLSEVRKANLKKIRQAEFDRMVVYFNKYSKQYAEPFEISAFESLAKSVQNVIDRNDQNFYRLREDLIDKIFEINIRQDWFIVMHFKWMAASPHVFSEKQRFEELTQRGTKMMRADDIDGLRSVVYELSMIQENFYAAMEMNDEANVMRG